MKTEAERRLDRFLNAADVLGVRISMNAKEATALFSAIFDPLPPEPEPVKTLGEVAYAVFYDHPGNYREAFEAVAEAVRVEIESRRPKPTVGEVARVMLESPPTKVFGEALWERSSPDTREYWIEVARSVFPLFGVEP